MEWVALATALLKIIADLQASGAKLTADQQAAIDATTQRIAAEVDAADTVTGSLFGDAGKSALLP